MVQSSHRSGGKPLRPGTLWERHNDRVASPRENGEAPTRKESLHGAACHKAFEEEAVRLVRTSGRAKRETADDLGVGVSTLGAREPTIVETRWSAFPNFGVLDGAYGTPQVHGDPLTRRLDV